MALPKKMVYDISKKIFEDKRDKYIEKRIESYYQALRHIRGEPEINNINDGFVISPPKNKAKKPNNYRIWDSKGKKEQNIYYMHGALHIYADGEKTKKLVLLKGHQHKKFINEIIKNSNSSVCVFEHESKDKIKKIKRNGYLKFCYESLKSSVSPLFIVGWSCSKNDQHLIDAINDSKIKELYISYYNGSLEELSKKYKDSFPKKSLYFFKSSLLPFSKK